jgi:hypothetical protein
MSRAALVRTGGTAAVVGGVLRAAASFAPSVFSDTELQVLYLVIDVLLLLGVLGFYEFQHDDLGWTGAIGFLMTLLGLLTIRSSRAIPRIDLYPIGALVVGGGVLTLCVSAWKVKALSGWVPLALLASILTGLVGAFIQTGGWLSALSGVTFGVAFAGLGRQALSAARRLQPT